MEAIREASIQGRDLMLFLFQRLAERVRLAETGTVFGHRRPGLLPYTEGVNLRLQLLVDVQTARFWADWHGTVMEQRGRNRWQTFGSS